MLKNVLLVGTILAALTLVVLLNQTTPTQAGPIGVLAFFIAVYGLFVGLISFALYTSSRAIGKVSKAITVARPLQPLSLQSSYYYASIIALAPAMLLGMQSVGGVGLYEFILVILFVIIGCMYIGRKIA